MAYKSVTLDDLEGS